MLALGYLVADLSLAEAGRHQFRLADNEMPGLGVPVDGPYKLEQYRY